MTARRPFPFLNAYYFLLIALLYLPLAVLLLFSFHTSGSLTLPITGLSARWYSEVFGAPELLTAARNSLVVAVGSSLVATALGTAIALLMARYEFRGKALLITLAVLPLIVPFIVLGVALLLLFSTLNIPRSLWTVGAAHVVVGIPYCVLIISARLAGFDPALEDAAMDLGASYVQTLRYVVLPIIFPAMVAAWLVAFTVSFDEFALALFLAGSDPTFPVYVYGQLRFASRLPLVIALAVLMMLGTLVLVLLADRLRRSER
jgi:spermidine/putrescine transport system permease protein